MFPGAYGAILGHSVGCRLITIFSHQSCLSYLHGKTVHPNGPAPQTSFASIIKHSVVQTTYKGRGDLPKFAEVLHDVEDCVLEMSAS